jgi:hypothetical protein
MFLFQLTGSVGNWNSSVTTGNVLDLASCAMAPRTVRTAPMSQIVGLVSK